MVPASIYHEVEKGYSYTVYGGVQIAGSLNQLNSAQGKPLVNSVFQGKTVYRVWGNEAGPHGRSWTTVNPNTVAQYRDAAGLPNQNAGRFVSEGILRNTTGVTHQGATPLHGNKGGLSEVVIPNAQKQVELTRVSGVNPQF